MDMSYQMMQQIKEKEKLTFGQADGTAIPFFDNAVDLIISLRLIHRLPADIKNKFFTELARVSNKYIIFFIFWQFFTSKNTFTYKNSIWNGTRENYC